jgi:branched-chain amino acid transport system substrate-binding protein
MTRKSLHWIPNLLLVAGTMVLYSSCSRRNAPEEGKGTTLKIGVLTPLTGGEANYGRSTKRGVDLAVDEANAGLAGKRITIRVIYEDDQMDAKVGTSAIQKLITVDKVPVIIGPFGSSVLLAVAPIAERNKTVIISASATADAIADAGDYVFRVVPPNRRQAKDIAEFAWNKLKTKRASILYLNNDYGVSLRQAFEPIFKALGGEVVSVDSFESGATDFRTQLTRIKSVTPDAVFFPDHYKETALILKQARELGVHTVFIGGDGACTVDLIKLAGPAAEGAYFANMAMDFGSAEPRVKGFVAAFHKKYGEELDVYAAYAYDAAQIVVHAVTRGGNTADAVKSYLYQMPAYDGITGSTKFDARGEVDKPFGIQIVKDGRFQSVP